MDGNAKLAEEWRQEVAGIKASITRWEAGGHSLYVGDRDVSKQYIASLYDAVANLEEGIAVLEGRANA